MTTPTTPPDPEQNPLPDLVAGLPEEQAAAQDEEDAEAPLNRAARRNKGKEKQKPLPGHVGPQLHVRGRGGNAPRSHTKRRSG